MKPRGSWNPLKLLFAFDGPIDRGQFWGGQALTQTILFLALVPALFYGVLFLLIPLVPASIWAYTALLVKRLWDLNLSGWRSLMVYIPFIGQLIFWQIATEPGVLRIQRLDDHLQGRFY